MDNILHLNLKPQNAERVYTADVYSYDMKKYQFQQVARTANAAYYAFVDTLRPNVGWRQLRRITRQRDDSIRGGLEHWVRVTQYFHWESALRPSKPVVGGL